MSELLHEQVAQLQEKMAYQERTIEELNDALSSQQRQLTELSEQLRVAVQLIKQWRADGESNTGEISLVHEIPPHY